MSYEIKTIPSFDRDFKRLYKRYRSLVDDIKKLTVELQSNPFLGADLGHGIRKIRIAIKSKGGGKRGGARLITHTSLICGINEGVIYFLALYDKGDQESISNKEIKTLIKEAGIIS